MNGSDYKDPAALEITTIEAVIYMGMKNDVSFLVGNDMNLYEHQFTWNPNMPLRGLFYFAQLYQGYVESRHLNIYSTVRLKLPVPRYVVFYNGPRQAPEVQELRLSDSFAGRMDGASADTPAVPSFRPALECLAQMININYGQNQTLMGRCRELYEYSYFIDAVQRRLKEGLTLQASADGAVKECIDRDILKKFLLKHRAEVTNVILEEFNLEQHVKSEKQVSYDSGFSDGHAFGFSEGRASGFNEGHDSGFNEGRASGFSSGLSEGRSKTLIRQVCRLLQRGNDPSAIIDLLGEDPEEISRICDAARAFAPEYDCEQIYRSFFPATEQR